MSLMDEARASNFIHDVTKIQLEIWSAIPDVAELMARINPDAALASKVSMDIIQRTKDVPAHANLLALIYVLACIIYNIRDSYEEKEVSS